MGLLIVRHKVKDFVASLGRRHSMVMPLHRKLPG